MTPCLVCRSPVEPFISFGQMPIANGFLTPAQFADEHVFELKAGFCETCTMVQLVELVDREKMFHENYAFFSSTSLRMAEHFKRLKSELGQHLNAIGRFILKLQFYLVHEVLGKCFWRCA